MTGFASRTGEAAGFSWQWELRGVNAKGLDLRLRLPDWIDGLEAGVRAALTKALARGSVSVNLRVVRIAEDAPLTVNDAALSRVLAAIADIEVRASAAGVKLAQTTALEVLNQRGVQDANGDDPEAVKALQVVLLKDVHALIEAFCEMRASEGRALKQVLLAQIDAIADLIEAAAQAAARRAPEAKAALQAALARTLDNADNVEPERVAQELALIAVKADVTEEIDRLRAHVDAARELLDSDGSVGRKFDFLAQEFNREANTLCSKSQSTPLTRIGLDLKAAIDQMREQVQNVE